MPRQSAVAALRRRRRSWFPEIIVLLLLWAHTVHGEGHHIQLVRRQNLSRRSSPAELAAWALRERDKVVGRYNGRSLLPTPAAHILEARQTGTYLGDNETAVEASSASFSALVASDSAQLSYLAASASVSVASSVGQVQLTNYQSDLEYYAPIYIGTPARGFNVILDTGSADFWLVAFNCTTTQCGAVPRINPNASSTCQNLGTKFSVRYGVGSASGWLYSDNITLADRNLSSQAFGVSDMVTTSLLSGNVSGLMGLGFQALAATGLKPLWQNILEADLAANVSSLTFPGFAFALTRFVNVSGASLDEFGGIFSIGTLSNSSYVGNISFVDIPTNLESYWLIPMDAVVFNGTDLPNVGTPNVAIDTGTTLVGGPQSVIANMYSLIPGSQAATGPYAGYYTFPCNSTFPVGLTFGGITYNLTSADINLGLFQSATSTAPAMCLGSFFDLTLSAGSSAVISWVVGDAFLKNVYSVYRYLPNPAIGFAALSPTFQSISPNGPLGLSPSRTASQLSIGIAPSAPASGGSSSASSFGSSASVTAVEDRNVATASPVPSSPATRPGVRILSIIGTLLLSTL